MRFHVVSLPHTCVTKQFESCAFTAKTRKFCKMMKDRGHTVYLYGSGEENEAPCDEFISCLSENERKDSIGNNHYTSASFDYNLSHWVKFNTKAANGIKSRSKQKDFVCLIGGLAHKAIADSLPGMMCVEFGVGYGGVFSPYKVFESYAWMHTIYGSQSPYNPCAVDGRWYDEVIPGFIDLNDFPFRPNAQKEDPYFLFIGRLIKRKGYQTAIDACKSSGARLILAGPGTPPDDCEYVGVVGPEKRAELMGGAQAVFVPTEYIEPFGTVAIEAMACGTPIITTDWGAMTETNLQGVTGYRCRTLSEFIKAMDKSKNLCRIKIREHAEYYGLDNISKRYENYFNRLLTLWNNGWYEK